MRRIRMLIVVLSCHMHAARREACLATWADVGRRDDVDLVFIVGDGPGQWPVRDGCLLHCPCPDDYESLWLKTRWLCLWAIASYTFDYLFKCDDDTYVNLERLLRCDVQGDYVGGGFPGDVYPHASGGAGYRLTPRAAIQVAVSLATSGPEDWLVWKVLTGAGIPLRSDPRFNYNCERPPAKDNDQITCHWCNEQRMREIHEGFRGTDRVPSPRD